MTGGDAAHTEFTELAAGYALNALEPADEQRFLRHAADCPDCGAQLAGFFEVAAALAETAPAAEPDGDLGARILAAARAEPAGTASGDGAPQNGARQDDAQENGARQGDARPGRAVGDSERAGTGAAGAEVAGSPAPVVPLRPRQWPRRAVLAAAAALVAIGGIWGGLAATSGGTRPALAVCTQPHACTEVPLVASAGHRVLAKVIVHGHEVWMQNVAMTANPSNEIYVLWQVTGSHPPLAVGSFDVRGGGQAPIRVGGLAAPYPGTSAFAISLEHGRTIPAAPSDKLAVGLVS
jgi:hypothetical protein